ncbi:glycosyltransferase family 39 protein, partial [PVC group bacterium]|nr:glycosyltransferase family 39 protein [PVC group bacterium]
MFSEKLSNKKLILFLVLLGIFLFVLPLGRQDIMLKAEARIGIMAKHAIATGEYLTLRLDDEIYLKKPPLFHWLVMGTSRIAGHVSEFTIRFPSGVAALLCLITLFLFGQNYFDRKTAFLASLILATNFRFLELAKISRVDMLLCFWILLSFALIHTAYKTRSMKYFYLSVGATGLAFLTKGPVGVILVYIPFFVFWFSNKSFRKCFRLTHLWRGLAVFLLIASPWYLYVILKIPGALDTFLNETLGRFRDQTDHVKVLWYLPFQLLLDFMPWTVFAGIAGLSIFKKKNFWRSEKILALITIVVTTLVFLSLSRSKQGTYLLPALPILSLLGAKILYEAFQALKNPRLRNIYLFIPFYGMLIYHFIDTAFVLPYWNTTSSYKPSSHIISAISKDHPLYA